MSNLDPKYFFDDGSKRPNPYRDDKGNLLDGVDSKEEWAWAKEQQRLYLESLSEEELEQYRERSQRFQRKMQSSVD